MAAVANTRVNLDEPRYDQNTYIGRAKHFFITTNPLNLLATPHQLEEAKNVVEKYRKGDDTDLSEDQLWKAKHLYDSAYHPDTKEKMFILGRMSAQVPMNMSITGCMMTFYKTPKEVIFWQWFNQTFNAIVNYTNRSGDHPIPVSQLATSYVLATGGAVGTALTINSLVKRFPPVVGRMVPFVAVAAANCINIPCMRSRPRYQVSVYRTIGPLVYIDREVLHGIPIFDDNGNKLGESKVAAREVLHGVPIFDDNGNKLGESKVAARSAITQVVFSRIMMATPGMMIPPFIMEYLNKKPFMKRMPYLNAPVQVLLVGFFLVFATPLCCALFPQKSSLGVSHLEKDIKDKIQSLPNPPERVYFNKGL